MIHSMTAYAQRQVQDVEGTYTWDIRSINHRYLDIFIRLPDVFRELDPVIREKIRNTLKRGKLEASLHFRPQPVSENALQLNDLLALQLCKASQRIAGLLEQPALINPVDILQWPDVVQAADVDTQKYHVAILHAFDQALSALTAHRAREGELLKQFILQRIVDMEKALMPLQLLMPTLLQKQRQILLDRFTEANITLDPARLEHEMVLLAHKSDVTEEIERFHAHLAEIRHSLENEGMVGRRLDFLMQELNREANTLGSKSTDLSTTRVSVDLKVLIEQMREQIQNIE